MLRPWAYIDACGVVEQAIPDGGGSRGHLESAEDGFRYRCDEGCDEVPEFFVRAQPEENYGRRSVLELTAVDASWSVWWVGWPADQPTRTAIERLACARAEQESYVYRSWYGEPLHSGDTYYAPGDDDAPVLRSSRDVPGLDIYITVPERASRASGSWAGERTILLEHYNESPCTELDSALEFTEDSEGASLWADWLVSDVDDLDEDGDRAETVVRETQQRFRWVPCDEL